MRADRQTLINGNLDSIDAKALLKQSPEDQRAFWAGDKAVFAGAVPLVPAGALQAGAAYPSSATNEQAFYLPKYALRRQEGLHATRLTRHPASDDPAAPVGSLAVEIEALPAPAGAFAAQSMQHDVRLRLGYRIEIAADATDAAAPPSGAAALAGRWRNIDPDADGVVALAIEAVDTERLAMRCKTSEPPHDGAVSQTEGFFRDGEAMAMFHLPDRFISLNLRLEGAHLRAVQLIDVLDGSTPGDGMSHHAFARDAGPDEVPLIWFDLEPPVATGDGALRSVTQIRDDETYLRLFKVMTEGDHAARLEATCGAIVGQRTWRQVFIGHRVHERIADRHDKRIFLMRKQQAQQIRRTTHKAMIGRPELRLDPLATFTVADPSVRGFAEDVSRAPAAAMRPDTSGHAAAAVMNRPGVGVRPDRIEGLRPTTRPDRPVIEGGAGTVRPDVVLSDVVHLQMMDVMKDELAGARPPSTIVIDDGGVPVLTRRRDECVQYLAPFWFDRKTHPQMFDAPPEETGRLVLLRHEIRAGDRTATFYQDGLEPRQIYYEPEEFRLARSDTAPFAPGILFHMTEEVDADAANDGITFSVTLTYHALPFLHPALLLAARAHFGQEASIAPVVPAVSKLLIRLHGDASAALEREGAEIDFADGISDVLTLSEAEYHRLTTALQTVSGVGLEGEVEATLLDGKTARIPIRLGLRETVGPVFDWAVKGAGEGRYVLSLRNRIESPVRIDELPAVALGGSASAMPEDLPPAQPIRPGEIASVGYRVKPPDANVAAFYPAPVISVDPNLMAILAQTTMPQGYSKDTFDINVSIDPMFFSAVPGQPPLTGLRVDFRTRAEPVVLTPAQPSTSITLQMPLLLFVTNAAEAQHYSYSVTNLHAEGPGAATAFTAGSGNLEVAPAPLQPGLFG